jgi:uncharacterized protein YecE (DUF72 family)
VDDAESRLKFYSHHFPIVEVDSSYYAIPSAYTAKLWAERTPDEFTFDIKAFSLFTNHPTKTAAIPRDIRQALGRALPNKPNLYYRDVPAEAREEIWRRYKEAVMPLHDNHKLGLVLLQFPKWFHPKGESLDHILACAERLNPIPCSVEFRSALWLDEKHRDSTLSFLKDNGLAFVCVDEPQGFASSVPPVVAATADVALVRFHGRNAETWEKKGITAADRFDWYYSEQEMGEWVPALERLASETREVHALMNTNNRDQGIINAQMLMRLIGEETGEEGEHYVQRKIGF